MPQTSAVVDRPISKSKEATARPYSPPVGVQVCRRCVMDSTVSAVKFDENGICNHCHIHDRLNRAFPTGDEGWRHLEKVADKIREQGKGKSYDCIVGLSGGRDTTYCLYITKKLGLRPLALHFDNGWDSPVSKRNIKNVCTALDVDLECVIADWEESRELTNSTIRGSVPYIDLTDDIGIINSLYRTAASEGIRWIIHSHSFRTEGINPLRWNYVDPLYTRSLIKQHCRMKLKKFQNANMLNVLYWMLVKRIHVFTITNYYRDSGKDIDAFLKDELGWEDTGGWHFDNEIFGLQSYYARHKFGIDWRLLEFAALVREGEMTREEALAELQTIPQVEDRRLVDYALKKQGISREEFEQLLKMPPKYFDDYPTFYPVLRAFKSVIWALSRLNYLPPHTYEKYFEV